MSLVDDLTWERGIGLGGGLLTFAGAFLPWVLINVVGETVRKTGVDGDGIITVLLGSLALGIFIGEKRGKKRLAAGVLAGLITAGIAIMYIMDPAQGTSNVDAGFFEVTYEAGIGLYVTAVGGVAVFAGSLIGLRK